MTAPVAVFIARFQRLDSRDSKFSRRAFPAKSEVSRARRRDCEPLSCMRDLQLLKCDDWLPSQCPITRLLHTLILPLRLQQHSSCVTHFVRGGVGCTSRKVPHRTPPPKSAQLVLERRLVAMLAFLEDFEEWLGKHKTN